MHVWMLSHYRRSTEHFTQIREQSVHPCRARRVFMTGFVTKDKLDNAAAAAVRAGVIGNPLAALAHHSVGISIND